MKLIEKLISSEFIKEGSEEVQNCHLCCISFEHLLALVHLSILPNSLYLRVYPMKSLTKYVQEVVKVSMRSLRRSTYTAQLWFLNPPHLYAYVRFWVSPSPTWDT